MVKTNDSFSRSIIRSHIVHIVKVKVRASGNASYLKSAWKTAGFKIKVK